MFTRPVMPTISKRSKPILFGCRCERDRPGEAGYAAELAPPIREVSSRNTLRIKPHTEPTAHTHSARRGVRSKSSTSDAEKTDQLSKASHNGRRAPPKTQPARPQPRSSVMLVLIQVSR